VKEGAVKIDGVSAIAVVLILSFAINRIVIGLLFVLSFIKPWSRLFPEPALEEDTQQRARAERKRRLVYYVLAAILAIGVFAGYGTVRILSVSGFPSINPVLDIILTGLILVAASERIAQMLTARTPPAGEGSEFGTAPRPVG
jgi:hypothetical protein